MRATFALGLVGLLMAAYAVQGAIEGRGRDVVEGGVPAVVCLGLAVLTGRRVVAR
jgi:hypothetical protein